jgi:hypothetical protein
MLWGSIIWLIMSQLQGIIFFIFFIDFSKLDMAFQYFQWN